MSEQDLLSIDVEGEFRRMSEANCQDGGALPQLNRDCQQLDSFAFEGVLVEADIPFLQVAAQKLHGRRPRSLSSGVELGALRLSQSRALSRMTWKPHCPCMCSAQTHRNPRLELCKPPTGPLVEQSNLCPHAQQLTGSTDMTLVRLLIQVAQSASTCASHRDSGECSLSIFVDAREVLRTRYTQ